MDLLTQHETNRLVTSRSGRTAEPPTLPSCSAWLLLVCIVALPGCSKSVPGPEDPEFAKHYGELPRLQQTSNLKLRAHWKRVQSNSQLPADLQGEAEPFDQVVKRQASSYADEPANATERLARLFTRVKAKRLAELNVPRHYPPWPEELRKLSETRIRNEDARAGFAALIREGDLQLGHQFEAGLLADTSYLEYVRGGAMLELYHGVEMLRRNRIDEAMQSIESVLLAASQLGKVGHLTPRLAAAELHERAAWLLQAMVAHPDRRRDNLEAARQLVSRQLQTWPAEPRIWIAEQADGMHAYELIRAGYVMSVLNEDEVKQVDAEIGFDTFQQAIRKTIDEDQLFFLQAMDLLIDASEQPYASRLDLFAELTGKMARLRKTEQHPKIADWILLPHVQMGQRALALDQARFQALELALRESLGLPASDWINPLTGKPYRAEHDAEAVRIFDVGPAADDEPVIIPRIASASGAVRR